MGGRSEGLGGLRDGHVHSRCGSQQRLHAARLLCLNCATHEGLLGLGSLFLGRSNALAMKFGRRRPFSAF